MRPRLSRRARRDRWLEAEGYCVMRVSTAEVYGNVDGVLDTIWATLQEQTSGRGLDTPT
jgi:very-short-patch-repair endonuclease